MTATNKINNMECPECNGALIHTTDADHKICLKCNRTYRFRDDSHSWIGENPVKDDTYTTELENQTKRMAAEILECRSRLALLHNENEENKKLLLETSFYYYRLNKINLIQLQEAKKLYGPKEFKL